MTFRRWLAFKLDPTLERPTLRESAQAIRWRLFAECRHIDPDLDEWLRRLTA